MVKEGDVIKMGRVTIKVRELVLNQSEVKNQDRFVILDREERQLEDNEREGEEYTRACRVCFIEDDDENDPLISPCKCTGSVRYIHYDCLKKWLNSKIVSKHTTFSHSFILK